MTSANDRPRCSDPPARDLSPERLLDALLDKDRMGQMGDFIHGFIHNINGPLQNMSMITEILTKGQDMQDRMAAEGPVESRAQWDEVSARQQKRLAQLAQQVTALADMLRDFMIVHEIMRNESEIDLNHLMQKLCSVFHADLFFKHQVQLETDLESNLPLLRVYGRHLIPALIHLFRNALISMGKSGQKRLLVRTCLDGGCVVTAVRDTGCGLGGRDPEDLFKPFVSAWPDGIEADGNKEERHGLGLYLARCLLRPYGIEVELRSVEDGTEALVRVPVKGCKNCRPSILG